MTTAPRPGDKIRCRGCGAKVRIPDDLAVAKARCPRCRTPIGQRPGREMPETIGPYRIERRLATGGMGEVFAGRGPQDEPVAVKILLNETLEDENLVQRFDREGRMGMVLDHPHVVPVRDHGQTADGRPYLTMELIEGISLAQHVRRHGPLSWQRALQVFHDISEALAYLDRRGVVHRDLKPGNILLADQGPARLTDFGLAKCRDEALIAERPELSDEEKPVLTLVGDQIGTPAYMAPEQVHDSSQVDSATDVYGLAATMVYALSGEAPYQGRNALQVMDRVLQDPPVRVRDRAQAVPEAFDELLCWCLAKEAVDRPADAQSLLELVALVAAAPDDLGRIIEARRRSRFQPPWTPIVFGAGILVIAIVLVVYYWLVLGGK